MDYSNIKYILEGHYALCVGSQLFEPNEYCSLYQNVALDKNIKFSFWYYMWGSQIGTLEIRAGNQLLWSLSDRQKDEWLYAELALPSGDYTVIKNFQAPHSSQNFQITFHDISWKYLQIDQYAEEFQVILV
jgi:hypothetical protein